MPMTQSPDTTQTTFTTELENKSADSDQLIQLITEGLLEKKGRAIKVLDVRELTTLTDYFVICHGTSDTQIGALANSAMDKVKENIGENVWQREGMDTRRWIILDYVNVVVHIFNEEKREYYGIERMWNDAKITEISDN